MSNNISNLLESVQKEFEAKKLELENQFAKKKADLLSKVKIELAESLAAGLKIFEKIPADVREGIFADAAFKPILNSFGLQHGKAKSVRKKRTAAPKVTDEEILAYLSSERTTGEVKSNFKLSAVTVGKRLGDLSKTRKISVRKEGTSKYWKKA